MSDTETSRYPNGKTMNLVGVTGDLARAFLATIITPKTCAYVEGWDDDRALEKVRELTGRDVTRLAIQSFRHKYFGAIDVAVSNGMKGQRVRELEAENLALKEKLAKAEDDAKHLRAFIDTQVMTYGERLHDAQQRLDRIEADVKRAKADLVVADLRPAAVA